MSLIIDLNDTGIRVRHGEQLFAAAPGYALLDGDQVATTGVTSMHSSRLHPRRTQSDYWYRLDTSVLDHFKPTTRADLAAAQMRALLEPVDERERRGVIVVPPYLDRQALGLLQGVSQAVGFQLIGLIDSATAATRQHYVDAIPLHLEFGLHCAWVARLHQTERVSSLEDVQVLEGSGLQALYDAWLRWFTAEFVRQVRFDPLHSAPSEQALFDALPDWLANIARNEAVTLSLEFDGREYSIDVTRVDVVNVVFEHYQRVADLARAMLASGEQPVFQLRDETLLLPGLSDLLVARVGGGFSALPDDAMVAGVAARSSVLDGDATRVVRELPVEGAVQGLIADDAPVHGLPTHILLADVAYPLSQATLTIGGGGAPGLERYLVIEGGLAGVSSIHCELSMTGSQCLLTDRSRYGTFLNGNRINGSAALRAGDILRVGTPGQELMLIREESF